MAKKKIYYLIFFFFSCTIYPPFVEIDLTEQSIETTYGQPLNSLMLEKKGEPLDIILIYPNHEMSGSNKIFLDSISSNFKIIHKAKDESEKKINFIPNSIYELKHSGGDRASYYLTLEIDSLGKIYKVIQGN